MRGSEYQGSFLGRISSRRSQVASMDSHHEQELEFLDLFQQHVSGRFSDLLPPADADDVDRLLSIPWLRKLLDTFLCCEAEFKAVLVTGRGLSHVSKPPLDRLLPDLLDRTVKALDVCNAVSHGVDAVRNWQRPAEIAVCALQQRPLGEGQIRRARKALLSLASPTEIDDSRDSNPKKSTERTWSFGRRGASPKGDRSLPSPSWCQPNNWSASKQIQAMSASLAPQRGGVSGGGDGSGLAQPVCIMSSVLAFVMWTLAAAIPCQDRSGLAAHTPVPKNQGWAGALILLQEKISEEWRKENRRGSSRGLLDEAQRMEKICASLTELADSVQFPAEEERMQEVSGRVEELAGICRRMEEGLWPLQQQIREVFHRMVRSRTEVFEVLEQAKRSASASAV